jgi:nitrate/TMAO reductase-like tetraheme cytochrome c subunit
MRIMSLLIISVFIFFFNQKTESPHGPDFKVSCNTCHSTKGWKLDKEIYSFNHNTTRFSLIGQHSVVNCRQCHTSLIFSDAKSKSDCNKCHNDIHQATVGEDCSRCHTPVSWLVNNINEIHQMSRFPLVGAHRTADCFQCHKSDSRARFDVTGVNCIDCHRHNYLATTSPNHIISGFSEECITCHSINSFQWAGSGFSHNYFPLKQGHSNLKCTDCHLTNVYSDAKPDCYSCHQLNYNATTNPDHIVSKFSTNCQECHSLSPGWKPTTFDHTRFPLTLGHASPTCTDCHKGGNYSSTSSDCYSCHQTDYNNSINPNHKTLSFSTTCSSCHTTDPGWKPASYAQHDSKSFPIYSGKHRGQWNSCTDCHANPANYTLFTCITCHHKADMDNAHRGRNGYSYDSAACFRCHPKGSN